MCVPSHWKQIVKNLVIENQRLISGCEKKTTYKRLTKSLVLKILAQKVFTNDIYIRTLQYFAVVSRQRRILAPIGKQPKLIELKVRV